MDVTLFTAISNLGIMVIISGFFINRTIKDQRKIDKYEEINQKNQENYLIALNANTTAMRENTEINKTKLEVHKVLEEKITAVKETVESIECNMATKEDLKATLEEIKELIKGA